MEYVRLEDIATPLDRRRIETFYRERGYFSVRVEGPERAPGPEPDTVVLTWRVAEGPRTRLTEVAIDGLPDRPRLDRGAVIRLEAGAPFDYAQYGTAKRRLRAWLVRQGHAHARVRGRVEVDRTQGTARVVFEADPGPRVRLRDVQVVGLTRTPTSAVRNRVAWTDGDVFSPERLDRTRARLYALDQYAAVRLDYRDDERGPDARIRIEVEETERNELQLGVGGGLDRTTFRLRLRARYKRRSFPLPLTTFEAEAIPEYQILRTDLSEGSPTVQARLTLRWDDFLLPLFRLDNRVGFTTNRLEAYSWLGPDFGQTLSRPLFDDRLRIGLGWNLFHYRYSAGSALLAGERNANVGAALGVTEAGDTVVFLEPSVTFDDRDDALAPRRGWYARLRLEAGFRFGGDGGYTLLSPDLRGYLPLGSRLVLAGRVHLTSALSGRLPAPRRLFAGGATSQRGFAQRRLSPLETVTDEDGEVREAPVGDQTVLETSVEARLRLFQLFGFWFSLAAFVDGGDLVATVGDLDPANLHWAVGGGIRYYTPIGAIRVDVAGRLNRRGANEFAPDDPWAWHLTLGEAF